MLRPARTRILVVAVLCLGTVLPISGLVTANAVPSGPTPASPMCGVADLASVAPPTTVAPAQPTHVIGQGLAVSALATNGSRIFALDAEAETVKIYGLDGANLGGFTVPWRIRAYSIAVDATNNVYLGRYPSQVVKLNDRGTELWSKDVGREIIGLYSVTPAAGFRVGAVMLGQTESVQYTSDGTSAGISSITGTAFSPASDGGVVATDGYYVRRYSATGTQLLVFGDDRTGEPKANTGEPYQFYSQGGAALAPDGTFVVGDATRGMHWVSGAGYYKGLVPDDKLGFLTERSWLIPVGDRLYYSAGYRFNNNQNVSWVSFADVSTLATAPRLPDPVLGFGAGLVTGRAGQYFPPGTTPTVSATFDPWWAGPAASGLSLRYSIRERKQVVANTVVPSITVLLPTSVTGLASMPLTVPSTRAGAYEVNAQLITGTGAVVGSTCLRYTVGAPGHRLDFSTLPAGAGHGGPAPPRGIALADQLGIGALRVSVEWARLLPTGSGTMDYSHYDAAFAAAAAEAKTRGVTWWVQVGEGKSIEQGLVANGQWESRVKELVTHFKGIVPAWEAWNEPNNSYGTADQYVSKVLAPFSRAVRAADPAAKVIGASVLDMDLYYFDQIGVYGGYPMMDIVSVHPYPGHNRAYEEHAIPPAMTALDPVLAKWGAATKPLYVTELAWWADGPGNYYSQADKTARAMIWHRTSGVDEWSYLMTEAAYGDYGLSYSWIQGTSQPDYVKPAALAAMTAASQLDGRPYTAMAATGIPHAYAATFGARTTGGDTLMAAWTDDLNVGAVLTTNVSTTVTVTDELGDATTSSVGPNLPLSVALSGAPVYITAPSGVTMTLKAAETFGRNVALASGGATASATSATSANPPAQAIDGIADAMVRGDLVGLPGWSSAPGDQVPSLTVRLPAATRIDRVLISGHSNGSIVTGLRNYDVLVEDSTAGWVTVGTVRDQFHARMMQVAFTARTVTAIKITVSQVNYSGYTGGSEPWFWLKDAASQADPTQPWFGPAFVYEVEAYEPGVTSGPVTTTTTTAPTTTTTAPTTTTTAPTTTTTVPPPPSGPMAARRASDFDGDGRHDVAVYRPSTSTWWIVPSSTGYGYPRTYGAVGDVAVPGDYDADGKDETAVWRPSNGTWYAVNTSSNSSWTLVWGVPGDIPAQADYDGDRRDDVTVWRPSTGTWWTLQSSTGTMVTRHYGQTGDIPVPADYDNDGKADIAVWRPSTGTWFIIQSSTGVTITRQLGLAGDVAAPADYDGDGKADSAVWRPSTGTWYILQTTNNLIITRTLGVAGDVAAPGDFDKDGRAEVTVWKPSTGNWTALNSSGLVAWTMYWGLPGDVAV